MNTTKTLQDYADKTEKLNNIRYKCDKMEQSLNEIEYTFKTIIAVSLSFVVGMILGAFIY